MGNRQPLLFLFLPSIPGCVMGGEYCPNKTNMTPCVEEKRTQPLPDRIVRQGCVYSSLSST